MNKGIDLTMIQHELENYYCIEEKIGRASCRERQKNTDVKGSSRRRHTIWPRDWSSDVCSSDLIVLKGTEIKSIRAGRVSLKDAHCRIINGEAQLINMHIAPYEQGNRFNHDPT